MASSINKILSGLCTLIIWFLLSIPHAFIFPCFYIHSSWLGLFKCTKNTFCPMLICDAENTLTPDSKLYNYHLCLICITNHIYLGLPRFILYHSPMASHLTEEVLTPSFCSPLTYL